jgi:hypothetical protein
MGTPILVVSGPAGAGKTTASGLVAGAFDPSVHIQSDAFMPFVVNGWIDPWLPESDRQNDVLGGAVASAAIQFAAGGYTVLLDGTFFPAGIQGMSYMCSRRGIPLHYAVLRPDLATCVSRVGSRRHTFVSRPEYADFSDYEELARLHARYQRLGEHEANVIDGSGEPQVVAEELISAFKAGRLAVSRPTSASSPPPTRS